MAPHAGNTSFRRADKENHYVRFRLVTGSPRSGPFTISVVLLRSGKGASRSGDKAGEIVDLGSTSITFSAGARPRFTSDTVRAVGGAAAKWCHAHGKSRAVVHVSELEGLGVEGAVEAFCEGFALGAFRFDQHKSKARGPSVGALDLLVKRKSARLSSMVRRVASLTDAVNLARDWGHEPPNVINPVTLAGRISKLARTSKLKCKVLDEKQLKKIKAEAILQVGIASRTQPRLIVLEYSGAKSAKAKKPVVLVGKAITFDTGGYSLKNTEGIVGMKYDKCGGMAVIGALQAAAALKIDTPVVGIIAAAENMISGSAYRPNDIVKTMSGKTVEIISTDAEGRMVLADALTYAQKHYKPRAMIDLATLTGGVVVALGDVRAGMFTNNEHLATGLFDAGERVHERLWKMPLDEEYLELIRGDDSDLKNSGGRKAHPVIGGMFLKQFVDDKIPWAHLDIAGTATTDKDQPYCPKGATGFGVRLLIDFIENLK